MKCVECKTELAKDAKTCPSCGRAVFGRPEKIVAVVLFVVCLTGVFYFFDGGKDAEKQVSVKIEQQTQNTETPSEQDEAAMLAPVQTPEPEPEPTPEPEIPEAIIKIVQDTMMQHDLISDIAVVVKEDEKVINIAIIANAAIKPEMAKEYGEDAARMLAALSSNPKKPGKDYLGGIYDIYNLHVGVFTASKVKIVRGAKVTASPKITW